MQANKSALERFRYEVVPKGPRHKAQRYALSSVLINPDKGIDEQVLYDQDMMRRALMLTTQKWRKRLTELRKLGWDRLAGYEWLHHANCPPACAFTTQAMRPCREVLICPFCWARMVVLPLFESIEWELYGTKRKHEVSAKTGLNEVVTPLPYDIVDCRVDTTVSKSRLPAALVQISKDLRTGRKRLFCGQDVGAFTLATAAPDEDSDDVALSIRMLGLVHKSLVLEKPEDIEVRRYSFTPESTRLDLAVIVGRVCEYPAGLLLGPAALTFDILKERESTRAPGQSQKPRLSMYYGCLRNESKRLRETKTPMLRR